MSEVVRYWLDNNNLTLKDLPPSVASHLRAAQDKKERKMTDKEGNE
jgi:antitoxin component HigA of HigAB toxin-antitoxin module